MNEYGKVAVIKQVFLFVHKVMIYGVNTAMVKIYHFIKYSILAICYNCSNNDRIISWLIHSMAEDYL